MAHATTQGGRGRTALMFALGMVCGWFLWLLVEPLAVGHGTGSAILLALASACFSITVLLSAWRAVQLANRRLLESQQLLESILDTVDMGLEVWDPNDRLLLYNRKVNQMRLDFHTMGDIGKTFESLIRDKLEQHQIPAAIGREQQWLEQRMAARENSEQPQLKEYSDNHWYKTHEVRTSAGHLVTSWVDVTELVRKSRLLEDINSRLSQESSLDGLTGLTNRRRFDENMAAECQRAMRAASALCMLMLDIDHFKLFNDHYGHLAGDECLRTVAKILRLCARRSGEIVARFGGEEFVVLMPNSDLVRAIETAQQCLEQLALEAIPHAASPTSACVTVSIGIACFAPTSNIVFDPGSIINAADAAMYRAKVGGRAQYQVADTADWEIEKDTPRTRPGELRAHDH